MKKNLVGQFAVFFKFFLSDACSFCLSSLCNKRQEKLGISCSFLLNEIMVMSNTQETTKQYMYFYNPKVLAAPLIAVYCKTS